MIDTGQRDKLVTVEARTVTRDAAKAVVETWAPLFTTYMAVVQQKIRQEPERYVANQLSARQDTVWQMRFRDDMDPEVVNVASDRRLVFRGRIYDIVRADRIGFRDEISVQTLVKADAS